MNTSNIIRKNTGGSLGINTRAMEHKTSSNRSFNEEYRASLKNGTQVFSSALRSIAMNIPGGAQLSASLSQAARNLNSSGPVSGSINEPSLDSSINSDYDVNSSNMALNNEDLLNKQTEIGQITAKYTVLSSIIRAKFEMLKTIGANIGRWAIAL